MKIKTESMNTISISIYIDLYDYNKVPKFLKILYSWIF